ncbi:hypothetical protein CIW52_32185 [Mycolicibacterium sp. P9-64]|uniref:hypothetical protein n=1 Tax=Mycolicibacterium sp. P9-64 TaxID=2024612 RepID=UPI0011ED09AD|nr:hypothetical protein [Mycolicibacterium sp. P9-64]KAA0077241.1 hypothetical protein CIW52_32185 [Mycolicibacterium sp. P9-64]
MYEQWPRDSDSRRKKKRQTKTIGAIVTVAVLAGLAFGASKLLTHETDITDLTNKNAADYNRQHSASTETPNLDHVEYLHFFSDAYTDEQRINWAYGILNQPSDELGDGDMTRLEAAHKHLEEEYNKPGGYEYVRELVEPSEQMTGDQINDLASSIGYFIEHTGLDENNRVKLLAAVVSPDFPYFQSAIRDGGSRLNLGGLNDVLGRDTGNPRESPIFSVTAVGDYIPKGTPSKVMDMMPTTIPNGSEKEVQIVYQFIDGKPVLARTKPLTSSDVDPRTIHD